MTTPTDTTNDYYARLYMQARQILLESDNGGEQIFALDCIARTAEEGHPDSCFIMAQSYGSGSIVEKDEEMAAQYNLGTLYEEGRGVKQNDKKAAAWFRKAAEREFPPALNNLGIFYLLAEA